MNETEEITVPSKSRSGLWAAIAVALLVIVVIGTYIVLVNRPKSVTTTSATPAPQLPTKSDVGQIMNSVDDKINQATSDQAAASAALKQASTPVKVDM